MNSSDITRTEEIIQKIVTESKPKTVKQLIDKTKDATGKSDEEIYKVIQELEKTKKIRLGSPKISRELPKNIQEYLFGNKYFVVEFWLLTILICSFFLVGILIPPDSAVAFIRVIYGFLFGLLVPGWTVTNLLFPKLYESIDQLERTLLAIGMNIGIIIFSGLILNEIWVIDSTPFVIIIGSFSLFIHILSITLRILIGSETIEIRYRTIKTKINKRISSKKRKKNDDK